MSHIPLGYRIENGKAVIDEPAAEQVRNLFRNYLSGMALVTAASEAGIETYHATVSKMLANRRYLGDDFYPQIIDPSTFRAAQQERRKRAKKLGRDHFVSEVPVLEVPTEFEMRKAVHHYDNPAEQAEYLYTLIESEI